MRSIALGIVLLTHSAFAVENSLGHCLYLIKQRPQKAIELYRQRYRETEEHDYEIVRTMATLLLQKASEAEDLETRMLATYGAGLSASNIAFSILEKSVESSDPNLQLVGIFFLAQMHDDPSRRALEKAATSSPFLSTRAEACYHLARRQEMHAASYIHALMSYLPPFFRPFFPQFFAASGSKESNAALRQLLQDTNALVRVQSILSVVQHQRDDFLPLIRRKASQRNLAEMEACAYALGALADTASAPILEMLANRSPMNVRIAALKSLYLLGDQSKAKDLELLALSHNAFAVQALVGVPGTEDTLYELVHTKNRQVHANAVIALLAQKDPRACPQLIPLLIDKSKDLGFRMQSSIGGAQSILKVVTLRPESTEEGKKDRLVSNMIKEKLLRSAMHLPQTHFLSVIRALLKSADKTFVPCIMGLLKNLRTEPVLTLLKEQAEALGSPLVRNYANLILFALQEPGPYKERVYTWLNTIAKGETVEIHPPLSLAERQGIDHYGLSAKEKSQLLLDTCKEKL